MEVNSIHISSGKGGKIELADSVFAAPYNEALLHQVVVAQLAGLRSGTAVQKNRAAVRGGGRKPWKQKGGGRARAGSIRSPIWRGGGRAFPGVTQSYKQKVNFFLSLRNFPHVGLAEWQDVGPADLLRYGRVLMDADAANKFAEVYG